jgi:hypothetical protein
MMEAWSLPWFRYGAGGADGAPTAGWLRRGVPGVADVLSLSAGSGLSCWYEALAASLVDRVAHGASSVKDHGNSPGVITGIPQPADGR